MFVLCCRFISSTSALYWSVCSFDWQVNILHLRRLCCVVSYTDILNQIELSMIRYLLRDFCALELMHFVCIFPDGYSGLVRLHTCSTLSTVQPVISSDSEASDSQSFFLVLINLLPFHSSFLPLHLPMFDGILSSVNMLHGLEKF